MVLYQTFYYNNKIFIIEKIDNTIIIIILLMINTQNNAKIMIFDNDIDKCKPFDNNLHGKSDWNTYNYIKVAEEKQKSFSPLIDGRALHD